MPTFSRADFAFGSADHDRPCPHRFRVERVFPGLLNRQPEGIEDPGEDVSDVLQSATPAAGAAR